MTSTTIETLKRHTRGIFYRSAVARFIIACGSVLTGRAPFLRVMHLLSYRDAEAIGPLQRQEALLLNAIVQTTMPRVVLEFGFNRGHSAFNFIQAADQEAHVYSFDNSPLAARDYHAGFRHIPNFHFLYKSQDEFTSADIDYRDVDLLLFDASHDLTLNQATWRRVLPSLSRRCLIVVHDTGTWTRADTLALHGDSILASEAWLNDEEFQHQPDERAFVNWITTEFREYSAAHYHSLHTFRHGLSILQRNDPLPIRGQVVA